MFLKISGRRYFFDKGLHFECQKCGACCKGEPGAVYIDLNEIKLIANYLGMKTRAFKKNISSLLEIVIAFEKVSREYVYFIIMMNAPSILFVQINVELIPFGFRI